MEGTSTALKNFLFGLMIKSLEVCCACAKSFNFRAFIFYELLKINRL